jgi:hypothetical protein
MTRRWVRSSYSSQDGGDCVEWAPAHAQAHGIVPVRDSKRPAGPVLTVSSAAWKALIESTQEAEA